MSPMNRREMLSACAALAVLPALGVSVTKKKEPQILGYGYCCGAEYGWRVLTPELVEKIAGEYFPASFKKPHETEPGYSGYEKLVAELADEGIRYEWQLRDLISNNMLQTMNHNDNQSRLSMTPDFSFSHVGLVRVCLRFETRELVYIGDCHVS